MNCPSRRGPERRVGRARNQPDGVRAADRWAPNRVSQIIAGKRSVTGDTALRFGHWFGSDPQLWLNLQAQYDFVQADRETGAEIRHLPTRAGFPGKGAAPGDRRTREGAATRLRTWFSRASMPSCSCMAVTGTRMAAINRLFPNHTVNSGRRSSARMATGTDATWPSCATAAGAS